MKRQSLEALIREHNEMQPNPPGEPVIVEHKVGGQMLKARIEVAGRYALWDGSKQGAKDYEIGEIANWKEWYAQEQIKKGNANRIEPVSDKAEVVIMTEPEIIEVKAQGVPEELTKPKKKSVSRKRKPRAEIQ